MKGRDQTQLSGEVESPAACPAQKGSLAGRA